MIENSKVKFGNPLPGYRFKPGECIVDTNSANDFRQGKCTQRDLDGVKMLVAEVGIDNKQGWKATVFCTIRRLKEPRIFHGIGLISGG
jgi:hypothetical protein